MYNIDNIFYREQALNIKPLLKLVFALIAFLLSGYFTRAIAWFGEDLKFIVPPSFLVGYMLPTTNLSVHTYLSKDSWEAPKYPPPGDTDKFTARSSIDKFLQSARMEGLWLQLELPARTNYTVGFTTSLGFLVPSNYTAQESYHGQDPATSFSNTTTIQLASRSWQTKTTLYNLKFSADFLITDSLTGMVGFLYDSFTTSYSSPENISPSNTSYLNSAQAGSVAASVGIPFIGIQYDNPLWSRLDIKSYIIGFPGLLGSISYEESVNYKVNIFINHEWRGPAYQAYTVKFDGGQQISSGYFYEAFLQCSTPVWRGIGAGAFLKYSEYSATLDHLNVTNGINNPVLKSAVTFVRKPLIIGATIMATF